MEKTIKKIYVLLFLGLPSVAGLLATSNVQTTISIMQNNTQNTFVLPPQLLNITKYLYKSLNFSPLFVVQNLLNPQKLRAHLLAPFMGNGEIIAVHTEDGEAINCTFFDRDSDKLLVIGTGFGNEREKVAPLVHMFDKYDVVIFDYRGHGYDQPKLLDISQWSIQPGQELRKTIEQITPFIDWTRVPNINLSKTTLGLSEEKDLLAVINHLKRKKEYTKTFGIGFCFSSFVFAKATTINPGLFDRIIFDSSLYSPQNIINRITESPQLLFDPQKGSWASVIKAQNDNLTIIQLLQENLLTKLATNFLQNAFANLTITTQTTGHYLSQLSDTPILFFHGKTDKMTPYNEDLIKNFTQTKTEKNHIKYKELYKGIATLFFELPYNVFIESLKDPQNFIDHEFNLMQKEVCKVAAHQL